MHLRLIAGTYGGRQIVAPDGHKTHPMSERIRNALFNSIGDEIKDAVVLDAFAGTGAIGLEAISRGAKHATFIERDRSAQKALAENIDALGVDDQAKLVRAPVASWINTYDGNKFDIIFADPPYHDTQFSTVSQLMGLLKPGALMVLSHPGRDLCPTRPGVVVVDNRSYGDATLSLFRQEGA
jgi:16S rRNA (guanine966-N2)-methyltransferase